MKITLTGALGHISRPLTQTLVKKGHTVTVISSKAERKMEIEQLGATAAIGTVEDVAFLAAAFTGADAVYCMLPPPASSDPNFDVMAHSIKIANNYAHAISRSGVRRVIHLSSIGAHTDKGNGILRFHFKAESIFKELPSTVAVTHLRPVGFYYNLLNFIGGIKTQGVIASNYGADDWVPWVSPIDIASAVAEELVSPLDGRNVRYVASEELTCNELASILGAAVGKPELKWIVIPNEQLLARLKAFGMNPGFAAGFVEMNAAMHSGELFEDYHRNRPVLGPVKVKDFAKEFAAVFNQK